MKNTKSIIIASILVTMISLGSIILVVRAGQGKEGAGAPKAQNVNIVDGKQIIEIHAKGGYQPRQSIAKAGIPTILRMDTSGTFDCSSSVRIPSMDISKTLPQTGITDIDLGTTKAGPLQGTCGMGMFPFEINFQS